MTMILLNTKYPKNVMGKSLTADIVSFVVTAQAKTPINTENPTVLLNISEIKFADTTKTISDANYCLITGTGDEQIINGYYYISDITGVSNGVVAISLELDILDTFMTDIQAQYAIVARSSTTFNTDIVDPNFTTEGGTETNYIHAESQNMPDIVVSMRTL